MKKLLGILGTITIAGSGMSGIVANKPHPTQEQQTRLKNNKTNYLQSKNLKNLTRNKRSLNQDRIDASKDDIFPAFRPDLWEEIRINYYYYSSLNDFQSWFKNRMNGHAWMDHRISNHALKGVAKNIWNNWSTYNNLWQNSTKTGNIWIKIAWNSNFDYRSCTIYHSGEYTNSYLNRFNNFLINTNLRVINSTDDSTIWGALKAENPNLIISQLEIINKTNTSAIIRVKNNSNNYSGGSEKVVYFNIKQDLNEIIANTNLNIINNNNNAILNELNYLNRDLDISQLEVVNKTNTSAIIKVKDNSNRFYSGSKKIYYSIDNNLQSKIINLDELIKKGLFLSFRDKNQGITIKEIKNINSDNLIYSNVTATKSIEPIYNENSKSICFGTTTLFHNLPEKQKIKTPNCKYIKETTISSQITTVLSKTNSEETRIEQTSTSSMENNWSIELSAKGGIWPFAEVSATAGRGGSYDSSNTNTSSETKTLSSTFEFSNNKTNEYKEVSEVELPSQEIEVNPNQKIKVTASLNEVSAQVTLKLTQNIYGGITSQIKNASNKEKRFEISIKEIMQKLKEYNLLPQEININNDDSITFNGSATRSLKKGFDGNIEFHEVK